MTTPPKRPNVPLTRSAIEAEVQRIPRELMHDLASGSNKKIEALTEELKALLEYVKANNDRITD